MATVESYTVILESTKRFSVIVQYVDYFECPDGYRCLGRLDFALELPGAEFDGTHVELSDRELVAVLSQKHKKIRASYKEAVDWHREITLRDHVDQDELKTALKLKQTYAADLAAIEEIMGNARGF